MQLSDAQLEKYQAIYKQEFGREISKKEAYTQGIALINMLKVISKPLTREQWNAIQDRRETTGYHRVDY